MKDAVLYAEKFISSKFCPSLSNYGGKAIDGFIAVTAGGLVGHYHLLYRNTHRAHTILTVIFWVNLV